MSALELAVEKVKTLSEAQARDLLAYLEQAEEDRADVETARRALAESGANVPWEEIKKESGLS